MDKPLAAQIVNRILAAERELGALSDLSEKISDLRDPARSTIGMVFSPENNKSTRLQFIFVYI